MSKRLLLPLLIVEQKTLCRGNVSSIDWLFYVHGVFRRLVLCYQGPECSNWRLREREILCCIINCVFKLPHRNVSSIYRLLCVHGMSRRLILCYYGPECSNWRLREREILYCIINCVFKLLFRLLFIICIFNKLFELSDRSVSSVNWFHSLYGMSRWLILRHHRPIYSDRCLCSWEIFGCLCECVPQLSR